jgi:hypothetical protein
MRRPNLYYLISKKKVERKLLARRGKRKGLSGVTDI